MLSVLANKESDTLWHIFPDGEKRGPNIIWVVFETGVWLMISLGILPTNIFQIITIHEGGIPINQPV
jgi:hypothetical protein